MDNQIRIILSIALRRSVTTMGSPDRLKGVIDAGQLRFFPRAAV